MLVNKTWQILKCFTGTFRRAQTLKLGGVTIQISDHTKLKYDLTKFSVDDSCLRLHLILMTHISSGWGDESLGLASSIEKICETMAALTKKYFQIILNCILNLKQSIEMHNINICRFVDDNFEIGFFLLFKIRIFVMNKCYDIGS